MDTLKEQYEKISEHNKRLTFHNNESSTSLKTINGKFANNIISWFFSS
jgi:hypothetical protein